MKNALKWAVAAAGALLLLSPVHTAAQEVEFLDTDERRAMGLAYSEGVRLGEHIYLSGVLGLQPGTTQLVAGGIKEETRAAMDAIKRALERYGSSMDRIVKCTVIVADIAEYGAMNEVYLSYFGETRPARTGFAASGIPAGASVEIDCIAAAGR